MDGRAGGSRGTDAPAETCLGLSTCRLSSQVIANGPISANLKVADPMAAMATARCVGNGVITTSLKSEGRNLKQKKKYAAESRSLKLKVKKREIDGTTGPLQPRDDHLL